MQYNFEAHGEMSTNQFGAIQVNFLWLDGSRRQFGIDIVNGVESLLERQGISSLPTPSSHSWETDGIITFQ